MIKECKNITFGVSEKVDGDMKLGNDLSSLNRNRFFNKRGLATGLVAAAGLADSDKVSLVKIGEGGKIFKQTDALITNVSGLALSVTVADCLPIFFYDLRARAIGLAHAGWRGLLGGIIGNTAEAMKNQLGARGEELRMFVGPHINKCHFAVGDDVYKLFKDYPQAQFDNGEKSIDLGLVAKIQAMESEVSENNIEISRECTYCLADKYFSYRRDKVLRAMAAFIVINN